jgi:membrane protein YdbS with pleckstrin-like domain
MSRSDRDIAEARARNGFIIINLVRFSGVALVMLGFAIVRGVIDLPYAVGAIIAVAGFFEVFFLPRFIARRWNAGDKTPK